MSRPTTRILNRSDVEHALTRIDPVETVENILREKQNERAILPAEACLYWATADGRTARSISMPGALPRWRAYGVKVINSSLSNVGKGLARASGFVMIFDPETAEVVAVMDAGRLSAYRTAAMSLVGARRLVAKGPIHLGLIGCGPIGMTHLELFTCNLNVESIVLHDLVRERAEGAARCLAALGYRGAVSIADCLAELTTAANCIVTATTVTSPYITASDLRPGQTIINVSLDDLDDSAFRRAEAVWVDDEKLVLDDPRRRLGFLLRSGALDRMRGELGQLISDDARGRDTDDDIVIFNPFGMAILDVGIAHAILGILPTAAKQSSFDL